MHTARTPPMDPAPAIINAVFSMHAGHIGPPLISNSIAALACREDTRITPLLRISSPGATGAAVGARGSIVFGVDVHILYLWLSFPLGYFAPEGHVPLKRFRACPVSAPRSSTSAHTCFEYRFGSDIFPPSGAMSICTYANLGHHIATHHLPYSSWRFHQTPVSLRPLGARSSH